MILYYILIRGYKTSLTNEERKKVKKANEFEFFQPIYLIKLTN